MPPTDDDLLAYFFHREPVPQICDVCAWVLDHEGADQLLEHTKTRIAIGLMVENLREAGHPLHMLQLHQAGFGFPGPDHPLEPRHWLWALVVMPGFMIGLDPEKTDI